MKIKIKKNKSLWFNLVITTWEAWDCNEGEVHEGVGGLVVYWHFSFLKLGGNYTGIYFIII